MDIAIDIPVSFDCYVDVAVLRLRYLYPTWNISFEQGVIEVVSIEPAEVPAVRREVNYALYRERIRAEGAPLRELLLKSVMT